MVDFLEFFGDVQFFCDGVVCLDFQEDFFGILFGCSGQQCMQEGMIFVLVVMFGEECDGLDVGVCVVVECMYFVVVDDCVVLIVDEVLVVWI